MKRFTFSKYLFLFNLLTVLLFPLQETFAKSSPLIFKPLISSSNLPTNEVRNLYQDSEGYIWISTYNGLIRFDGYSTVVYRPDGENKDRNIDGFINIVAEDKEHRLWIGTHSGLFVLDKRKDHLEKIVSPLLQVSNIEAIACTSKGEVWIGANKGIFRRKVGCNKFELCNPQIHPYDNQPHYDVKSIIEDRNGQIWIGTWEQGLLRYDPINGQYYTYPNINPSQSAHTLFQDNNGNIWIGT